MFQIGGDVKEVGFPVQNAYEMAYGDQNTTFEPVNEYYFSIPETKQDLRRNP